MNKERIDGMKKRYGSIIDKQVFDGDSISEEPFYVISDLMDLLTALDEIMGEHDSKIFETTLQNPIKYYEDGQPYLLIGDCEIVGHPIVEKLAEFDRLEKYILPAINGKINFLERENGKLVNETFMLRSKLDEMEKERDAAAELGLKYSTVYQKLETMGLDYKPTKKIR